MTLRKLKNIKMLKKCKRKMLLLRERTVNHMKKKSRQVIMITCLEMMLVENIAKDQIV